MLAACCSTTASEELDEDWNCSKNRRDSDNSAFSVDGGSDFSGMPPTSSSGGSSSGISPTFPSSGGVFSGSLTSFSSLPSPSSSSSSLATFVIPGAVSGRLLYVKETRRHYYTNRRLYESKNTLTFVSSSSIASRVRADSSRAKSRSRVATVTSLRTLSNSACRSRTRPSSADSLRMN